jgi:hypothetical protein
MDEYPEELQDFPSPVVMLMGFKSLHAQLLRNTSLRKDLKGQEIPNIRFLSVESGNPIPQRKKQRRLSYESYVPEGIFKSDWLHKHRNLIPSVVVLFFNWDEIEKNFKIKEIEFNNEIEIIK